MSEKPTIEFKPNGPLLIRNLGVLENSKGERLVTEAVIALCRCGGSANKPFCGNSGDSIPISLDVLCALLSGMHADAKRRGGEFLDNPLAPAG